MSKPTTSYNVQTFSVRDRVVVPEGIHTARDEQHAKRMGERLASSRAGVVVYRQVSNPTMGEYEEPVILARYGRLPPQIDPNFN